MSASDREPAALMRRRATAWAAGAAEGRALDHDRWRAMSPAERSAEALDLIRIAGRLRNSAARAVKP